METSLITLVVKPGEADRLIAGHPWVYSSSIQRSSEPPADGDLVQLKDHRHRFLGVGFYNSRSKIQVRMLSNERVEVNCEFFVERIGIGVSGPQLEKKLRDIYGEIDTENNAGKTVFVRKSALSQRQKKDKRLPCKRSLVARQTFPVLGPRRQNMLVKRK